MFSSSVPAPLALPQATVSVSPAHPAGRRATMVQYRKTTPARKGKELRDYESIWSKGASLGIRRDRETFSLRHSAGAHKAPISNRFAVQPTLLRRLFPNIRCMCADNSACAGKQSALSARRGQGGRLISCEESPQSQG